MRIETGLRNNYVIKQWIFEQLDWTTLIILHIECLFAPKIDQLKRLVHYGCCVFLRKALLSFDDPKIEAPWIRPYSPTDDCGPDGLWGEQVLKRNLGLIANFLGQVEIASSFEC